MSGFLLFFMKFWWVFLLLFIILIRKKSRLRFKNLMTRMNKLPNLLLSSNFQNLGNKYKILKTFQIIISVGFIYYLVKLIRFFIEFNNYMGSDIFWETLAEIFWAMICTLSLIMIISFLFDLEKKEN